MLALLAAHGVERLDGVVMDLGLSSFQIDDPARGFSFRSDGPLDMRMDRAGPTAADLVATLDEADLADTLYDLGEERLSRRIARAIVQARAEAPITTTGQLAAIIRRVVPKDASGIDPATRSFQALRIRVNDELGQIERALAQAAALLAPGGRLVVVSFHSGEDRLVKRFMADAAGRQPAPSRHDPRGPPGRPRSSACPPRARRPTDAEIAAILGPAAPGCARSNAYRRPCHDAPDDLPVPARSARCRAVPVPGEAHARSCWTATSTAPSSRPSRRATGSAC